MVEPVRFDTHRPMRMAGVRRQHEYATVHETIPAQWEAFSAVLPIPGQIAGASYGIICKADQKGMEYMCAVEVPGFAMLPDETDRLIIEEHYYAVFEHRDHISSIGKTWEQIMDHWMPSSSLEGANAPDFERYDERYEPSTGSGLVEIWVPVQRP